MFFGSITYFPITVVSPSPQRIVVFDRNSVIQSSGDGFYICQDFYRLFHFSGISYTGLDLTIWNVKFRYKVLIPAPDVNTNAEIMGWIMDTFSMIKGYTVPGVVTGKPIEIGGSLGRKEATGKGVTIITKEILHRLGMPVVGTKVAIQGMGNVGGTTAKLLQHRITDLFN